MKNIINWHEIYKNESPFHVYFTERKRGKTDTKAWQFLESIVDDKNTRFAWIRRRWRDSLDCSKPYFQDLIFRFCEEKGIRYNRFEVTEKGVFYLEKRRIYFYDLFSYQKARGAISRIIFQEIVYEEAIPIDQEFLFVKNRSEQWMFADLFDSLKRKNNKLKITFLANPYSWSAWFLDVFKNLFEVKRKAERLLKEQNNGGVLEIAKDELGTEWLLYVNLIEGEKDLQSHSLREEPNPFSVNWDDYMISLYNKDGNPKEYEILHAIQDFYFCEFTNVKSKYFLMHFIKNKKEVSEEVINYCFSTEDKAKSKLINCVVKDKGKLINQWINMLKNKELYFTDFRSRDWFLNQL